MFSVPPSTDLVNTQQSKDATLPFVSTNSVMSAGVSSVSPNTAMGENTLQGTPNKCDEDLATFLINRACLNDTLANYFFWYLFVECDGASKLGVSNAAFEHSPQQPYSSLVNAAYTTSYLVPPSPPVNIENQPKLIEKHMSLHQLSALWTCIY